MHVVISLIERLVHVDKEDVAIMESLDQVASFPRGMSK